MYPTTYLEWWHLGAWRRIGWDACNPRSLADLRRHGSELAAKGGHYRLVRPSAFRDAPPVVIHEFPATAPTAA